MNDQPTEPHYPVWGEEEEPTEEISAPPLYREEDIPTNYIASPPYVLPAPPVRQAPVENVQGLVDPRLDKRRGGIAALAFGMLILGGFLGFFIFTLSAAQQFADIPPEVRVRTQTHTATATATAYKTRIKKETVKPDPIEVTKTATATVSQKVVQPGSERTIIKGETPQSCLSALEAADQYVQAARQGRGNRNNEAVRQAREAYRYWSDRCRDDSG